MRRKIYDKLLEWKKNHKGDTSLLIEGARRIGKSYIVEEFARKEYASYILVDFSKVNPQVMEFFNLYLDDLDMLFMNLELYFRRKLIPRQTKDEEARSLVIFDEVQFCPRARAAIKHLVADRRYDYIETGSLISIKKNVKDIKQARSFPSRRMSRTSCCLPKNTPSKCSQWILRNSCGLWETRC